MGDEVDRLGALATEPSEAKAFFERVVDRQTGELNLERAGRFWEAVATGRRVGATGTGHCVAIIDGGFDPTAGLDSNLHPASRIRPDTVQAAKWHGTVVALLVRAVAPDAQLLLLDVFSEGSLDPGAVAAAIDTAATSGATVLNLSLEFSSDCDPQDMSWLDIDVALSPAPDPGRFVEQVDRWIEHAEPYGGARCRSRCEICDALANVPDTTLVVAASGNRGTEACPACFGRTVGTGFHRTERVEDNGVVFTTSGLAATESNPALSELLVEEPPGFLGTSFASPLLSGFGALLEDPSELTTASRLSRSMTPVLLLANLVATTPTEELGDVDPSTLHQGLLRIADAMPDEHKHFDHEWTRSPCPLCALLFVDWYDVFVSMLLGVDDLARALGIARIATILAPDSPSTNANHGLAAARAAERSTSDDEVHQLLAEARTAYERACAQAPHIAAYASAMARVEERLGSGS